MLSLTNYQPWKVSHVVKQLLHDAGQAFIKSESDEKLRQALWHQVRTSSEVKYVNGDKVYYKRGTDNYQKGPAIVTGQENQ